MDPVSLACFGVLTHAAVLALFQFLPADVARPPPLSATGHCVGAAIAATGLALLAASALDRPLGPPTFLCGVGATLAVLLIGRRAPCRR